MIIDSKGIDKVDQSLIKKANESQSDMPKGLAQEKPVDNKDDKIELSSNAIALNKLSEKTSQIPDVRQEKVSRIQKAIDDGSYQMSGQKIADKIIDEGLGLLE